MLQPTYVTHTPERDESTTAFSLRRPFKILAMRWKFKLQTQQWYLFLVNFNLNPIKTILLLKKPLTVKKNLNFTTLKDLPGPDLSIS